MRGYNENRVMCFSKNVRGTVNTGPGTQRAKFDR